MYKILFVMGKNFPGLDALIKFSWDTQTPVLYFLRPLENNICCLWPVCAWGQGYNSSPILQHYKLFKAAIHLVFNSVLNWNMLLSKTGLFILSEWSISLHSIGMCLHWTTLHHYSREPSLPWNSIHLINLLLFLMMVSIMFYLWSFPVKDKYIE